MLLPLLMMLAQIVAAQNWQAKTDTVWGNYCYRETNGKYHDALTSDRAMTTMPKDNNMVLAYYWRIPEGKVRANILWTNTYGRLAKMHVRLVRPTTGEVLAENDLGNTALFSEQHTDDLFGTVDFPADEFYRLEISSTNWTYVKQISRFIFQRESAKPVMRPRNFGGTSAHMFTWGSTDPDAPAGNAYDWAYIEVRVPYEYQYPGTYFMTIGTLNGYMGMQTASPMGEEGDFSRSVLFSVWDDGNTDENPDLAEHLQSVVMSGHPDAVHTHAGGEGSSASVMLKGSTKWWRPDKWVQFLQNTRPETRTITTKTKDGRDSTFLYESTICTAFYKMSDETTWKHLGTIRSAGINNHMPGWYSFIEPFTSYAGQKKHRALYRHPAMRAANSGKWYSRNKVDFWDETYDRDFHYDYGRGASQEYDNCFFFEMGGYGLQTDSSKITNLATDMSFVENINLDSLNSLIDHAIVSEQSKNLNKIIDQTADNIVSSVWTPIADQCSNGSNARRAIDDDESVAWICYGGYPYTLALKADEEQTITSLNLYWEYKYDYRCLYVDLATSADGETWVTQFDSLEIRTGIDRPDIPLPNPIKTRYVRLTFHTPFTTNNFMISELRLRGDYDRRRLLNLAKTELDNANTFNHYSDADLSAVAAAYNNGNPAGTTDLALALKQLAANGTCYKYSKVSSNIHISSQRAYIIQNASGNGSLCATTDNTLSINGATADNARPDFAQPTDITDPLNNWLVLHDEHYSAYYLYNLGLRKFLNLTDATKFSDTPQPLTLSSMGGGYRFNTPNGIIGADATTADGIILGNTSFPITIFKLYDNYQFAQNNKVRDSLQAITEPLDKLALYKSHISQMIDAPVGVVGGFTSEEAREALRSAYENADADPEAFVSAVENADIIVFDPDNSLYRIKSTTDDSTTPYLTADPAMYMTTAASVNSPEQIWRFATRPGGYSLHSQGVTPKVMPYDNNRNITLSTDPAGSGTYVISNNEWGKNYLSSAQHSPIVVGSSAASVRTMSGTTTGATWYLEPATTYSVSLNSAGVNSFFADFTATLPEGLEAYVANHVTPDGVIKLTRLEGAIPPNTPALLHGAPYAKFDLAISNTPATTDATNIFSGVYMRTTSLPKGSFYTLATAGGAAVMKKPSISLVKANQVYLMADEIMPALTTYTFDFDNIIDHVGSAITDPTTAPDAPAYDLNGRLAPRTVKGHIYIRNHKKILQTK